MSIQITINGESAGEALIELSTLAAGLAGGQAMQQPAKAVVADKPKKNATVKPETEKQADPEPEVSETKTEDPELSDSDAPVPTDVELRAAAQAAGAKGPEAKAAIKALLGQYGVPNITGVPNDQRDAFLAELQAI